MVGSQATVPNFFVSSPSPHLAPAVQNRSPSCPGGGVSLPSSRTSPSPSRSSEGWGGNKNSQRTAQHRRLQVDWPCARLLRPPARPPVATGARSLIYGNRWRPEKLKTPASLTKHPSRLAKKQPCSTSPQSLFREREPRMVAFARVTVHPSSHISLPPPPFTATQSAQQSGCSATFFNGLVSERPRRRDTGPSSRNPLPSSEPVKQKRIVAVLRPPPASDRKCHRGEV